MALKAKSVCQRMSGRNKNTSGQWNSMGKAAMVKKNRELCLFQTLSHQIFLTLWIHTCLS